jgi:hypothetical protein
MFCGTELLRELIGLKITVKQGDSADGNLNEQDL